MSVVFYFASGSNAKEIKNAQIRMNGGSYWPQSPYCVQGFAFGVSYVGITSQRAAGNTVISFKIL